MAKSKSSNRNYSAHSKSTNPKVSGSKKVIRLIIMSLVAALLLAGIVAAIIKYYRIATNH